MALIVAMALYAAAPAHYVSIRTWGIGTYSCGKWAEQRQAPKDILSDMDRVLLGAWLGGFLSASDSNGIQDLQGAQAWIDNYCQAHPLDQVGTAAASLVTTSKRH